MPLFHRKSAEKLSEAPADESTHSGIIRRLSSGSRKKSLDGTQKHDAAQSSHPTDSLSASITGLSKAVGMTSQNSTAGTSKSTEQHTADKQQRQTSQNREKKSESRSRQGSRSREHARGRSSSNNPTDDGNLTMGEATQTASSDALSRDDVRTLFSGAPHFMLEKGRRGRYFPQAFFPFASPLDITDLQDRQYLRHESFALITLHSHLPIPTEVNWRPGHPTPTASPLPSSSTIAAPPGFAPSPSSSVPADSNASAPESAAEPTSPQTPVTRFSTTFSSTSTMSGSSLAGTARLETNRRPMFDLGIYERPNMLSVTGVERGTFGMRAFLERPVADGLVDEKHEHADVGGAGGHGRTSGANIVVEHMSTSEALKALAHDEGSAKVGKHAPAVDRVALVRDGPKAWKRVGVREITMKTITERLEVISQLRDEVLKKGWRYTVLQVWTEKEMGEFLFRELLYPPEKKEAAALAAGVDEGGKGRELKVQIEALVKVLTTPGAWLDFSLPAERLLFSQNLYTREVRGGDGMDPKGMRPEMKRRWNLVQLLLAVELVIRLDAALRLGVALHSGEVEVSSVEIHHFNKLRNLKVDWDFVVARRWLDLCYVRKVPKKLGVSGADTPESQPGTPGTPTSPKGGGHAHRESFFGRFKESLGFAEKEKDWDWPFECAVLPRQPNVMADGLVRFAEDIGWDEAAIEHIRSELARKLCDKPQEQKEETLALAMETPEHPHLAQHHRDQSKVELKAARPHTLGGPLTHTWLGGFIIPGYITCDLLMCALLETDTAQRAVERLGNMAHPRSGFVLGGRSWWSKLCVVGVVLVGAAGSKERMGWIGLPDALTPVDQATGQVFGDGWRVIVAKDIPSKRHGQRILDGDDMAKESSPLGIGKGHVLASEFGMLTDQAFAGMETSEVSGIQLVLRRLPEDATQPGELYEAAVKANVKRQGAEEHSQSATLLPLRYNARFVGGHPCRPPHGHAKQHSGDEAGEQQQQPLRHKHLEHLPAHPLHESFKYSVRSIEEVLDLGPGDELTLPNPTDKAASHVWVIDARGGWERETLMRAWCASVGFHAIISRVGRSCLGCAVREAKALEIGIVIRVET